MGYSSSRDNFLGVAGDGDRYHRYKTFYVAPGLLYHPAGAFRRTDFSIGLQLACGPLTTEEDYYKNSLTEKTRYSSLFLAPLAAANVNFRGKYSNSLFGLHFAIGPALAGNYGLLFNGRENDSQIFVQVGVRIGGSF